ncbi:unnamed protein product [Pseudo-nitzschia multistriata]|uniref:DUF6824 domain-containing protein n=1 Tax=Pseudo-nitzschia multistriata TaxID=183589 RepID=A0A448ZFU1_9STRA|nr:unnamed protein product [Pseudo-nitzschia multistriata]
MAQSVNQHMVTGFGRTVRRIRNPNPQDVLSGRGGGINSHAGNKAFRSWVEERKPAYNLAENKQAKTEVAMQVVQQVHNQRPVAGRFLTKDKSMEGTGGTTWWVEIDEAKALAKTTQALREGAPKIREALQNQTGSPLLGPNSRPKPPKKRKRKPSGKAANRDGSITTATGQPRVGINLGAPLLDDDSEKQILQEFKQDVCHLKRYKSEQLLLPTSNSNLKQVYDQALVQLHANAEKAKKVAAERTGGTQQNVQKPQTFFPATGSRIAPLTSNKVFKEKYSQQQQGNVPPAMPAIDPNAATPPLMAAPEPNNSIPYLSLNAQPAPKRARLRRNHSLALSDYDENALDPATDEVPAFVDPFANETDVLLNNNGVLPSHATSFVPDQLSKSGDRLAETSGQSSRLNYNRSVHRYLDRILSFSSNPLHLWEDGLKGNNEQVETRVVDIRDDYFLCDALPQDE